MTCPICKKTTIKKYKPFCSLKCKQLDLFNWLNGIYSIPTKETIKTNR